MGVSLLAFGFGVIEHRHSAELGWIRNVVGRAHDSVADSEAGNASGELRVLVVPGEPANTPPSCPLTRTGDIENTAAGPYLRANPR